MRGSSALALGLAALLTFGITSSMSSAWADTLVGKPCTTVGATTGDGPGRTVVCAKATKGKNKGKLVWRLMKAPNPGPGPGPGPTPGPECTKRPTFSHDVIALDQVQVVVPIGQQTAFGGVLSVRSYIHSKPELHGQKLPLYAPTDLTLLQAAYYLPPDAPPGYKAEYSLFFDAGCGIEVQLYHVKGVSGSVAGVVPKEPVASSAGQPVTPTRIKAGEQIGWYEGEAGRSVAFDFRVQDARHRNTFINQQRFDSSPGASAELTAICPYDLYVGAQRERWLAKLGAPSSEPVPGTSCGTISQGQAGTAQGMWFFADAKVNELTYRGQTWGTGRPAGQYQSQVLFTLDPSQNVRIGGLNATAPLDQLIVSKSSPTWKDPATVRGGQEHCWSNDTRAVKVRLSTDGASLTAVVGEGGCSGLDLTRGVTYVR